MKKFIGILVVIALLAAIATPRIIDMVKKQGEDISDVNIITVGGEQISEGNLSNVVELIGTTAAVESVAVMPAMPAKVEEIKVVVGDYVDEGDVLFILDKESVENQVTQAEIGLTMAEVGVANAKAGIIQAEIGYDLAKSNYTMQYSSYEFGAANVVKYEALFAEGMVSEMELEQMKLQASPETTTLLEKQLSQAGAGVSQAGLGLRSAEASLLQATEGYEQATDLLEDMTVTAPISGFVTSSTISEGNMASNAAPAMMVDDMSRIVVSGNVTENLVNKLALGMDVKVKVSSIEGLIVEGSIKSLATSSDARSLLYPITVEIQNTDNMIKPGMFASIIIETDTSVEALYAPAEAVLLRDDTHYVYLQQGLDQVMRVAVEVGIDTGFYTEITSGVTAEDIIITKGIGLIDENSTIKVIRSDQ